MSISLATNGWTERRRRPLATEPGRGRLHPRTVTRLRPLPRLASSAAALVAALFAYVTGKALLAAPVYPTLAAYVSSLPVVGIVTPLRGEPTGVLPLPGAVARPPLPVYESTVSDIVVRCVVAGKDDVCMVFLEPAQKPLGWDSFHLESVAVRREEPITVRRDEAADTWVLETWDDIAALDGQDFAFRPLPFSDDERF